MVTKTKFEHVSMKICHFKTQIMFLIIKNAYKHVIIMLQLHIEDDICNKLVNTVKDCSYKPIYF
jgi:hypothetical protein